MVYEIKEKALEEALWIHNQGKVELDEDKNILKDGQTGNTFTYSPEKALERIATDSNLKKQALEKANNLIALCKTEIAKYQSAEDVSSLLSETLEEYQNLDSNIRNRLHKVQTEALNISRQTSNIKGEIGYALRIVAQLAGKESADNITEVVSQYNLIADRSSKIQSLSLDFYNKETESVEQGSATLDENKHLVLPEAFRNLEPAA